MAATGSREDPLLGFNFALELQGAVAGYFTEIGGVGSEHEIIEHKVVDTSGHETVQKIPGRSRHPYRSKCEYPPRENLPPVLYKPQSPLSNYRLIKCGYTSLPTGAGRSDWQTARPPG